MAYRDLNSLYNFLNILVLNKLTPEMVNLKDQKQILTLILEDLKGHPKLQLPIALNNQNIYKFYKAMKVQSIILDSTLTCVVQIPLIAKISILSCIKFITCPYQCQN